MCGPVALLLLLSNNRKGFYSISGNFKKLRSGICRESPLLPRHHRNAGLHVFIFNWYCRWMEKTTLLVWIKAPLVFFLPPFAYLTSRVMRGLQKMPLWGPLIHMNGVRRDEHRTMMPIVK